MASQAFPLSAMGLRLNATADGPVDGPVIILVAGWPQTLHAWRLMQPMLADRGYRAIAIDPPGLGDSDLLPPGMNADTGTIADLAHQALQDAGVSRFHLVGHDIGTWISYAWATRHPEGIERLCLTEANIPGMMPDSAFTLQNAPRIFQFFFNAVPDLPELLTEGRERLLLNYLFNTKMMVRNAITHADLQHYADSYSRPGRMTAGFAYYRAALLSARQNQETAPLPMPVLAIGGEGGVGDTLRTALATRSSDLRGTVLKKIGHYLPEEAPDAFTEHLLRFIGAATP